MFHNPNFFLDRSQKIHMWNDAYDGNDNKHFTSKMPKRPVKSTQRKFLIVPFLEQLMCYNIYSGKMPLTIMTIRSDEK